jgi:hypothetical protein
MVNARERRSRQWRPEADLIPVFGQGRKSALDCLDEIAEQIRAHVRQQALSVCLVGRADVDKRFLFDWAPTEAKRAVLVAPNRSAVRL